MEEKNELAAYVPQFTEPKTVPRRGRGFLMIIAVQAGICAAAAVLLGIAYLTAPDFFEYISETLLEAVGL